MSLPPAQQMETSVVNESVLVSGSMLTQLHSPSKALHTQFDSFHYTSFTDHAFLMNTTLAFYTYCPQGHCVVGVLSTAEQNMFQVSTLSGDLLGNKQT